MFLMRYMLRQNRILTVLKLSDLGGFKIMDKLLKCVDSNYSTKSINGKISCLLDECVFEGRG